MAYQEQDPQALNKPSLGNEFVYVLFTDDGYCKVGVARHIGKRMAALQPGCPQRIKFYGAEPSRYAHKLEKITHHILADCHSYGEWFQCDPERALGALRAVKKRVIQLRTNDYRAAGESPSKIARRFKARPGALAEFMDAEAAS